MSEIKLRVWHKRRKEMNNVWRIDFDDFGKPNRVYWDMQQEMFEVGHEISRVLELMQYTGMKDKTGKDIYEGDIVSIKGGALYKVAYDYEWFGFEPWVGFIDDEELFMSYNIEVIGNTYENPELLK